MTKQKMPLCSCWDRTRGREPFFGGVYMALVSGVLRRVRILREYEGYGGRHKSWEAVNVETHRAVNIRGVNRLRERVEEHA